MKIDFNHMLVQTIGEHGIEEQDIQKMALKIPQIHQNMCAKKDAMAWRSLPYNQAAVVADIKKEAERINAGFENFVVLGIGGSALGSKA